MSKDIALCLESIAYQTHSIYPKLISDKFESILGSKDLVHIDRVLNEISEITLKAKGLNIQFTLSNGSFINPYEITATVPNLDAFSPINLDASKRLSKLDLNNFKVEDLLTGHVDLKNGRVSGFFSSIKFKIMFPIKIVEDAALTAQELTAIYLHEEGHAFVTCEFLGNTLQTNTIMAALLGQVDEHTSQKRIYEIGVVASKISGEPELGHDVTVDDIAVMVLKGQPKRMMARTNSRWYDARLTEALADQYAARHMSGASLVTALGKMNKKLGIFAPSGYEPMWLGGLSNFMNLLFFPFRYSVLGSIALLKAIWKTYCITISISVISQTLSLFSSTTYDEPKMRLEAIRRESVGLLRDKNLPDDVRRSVLEDLKIIDKEIGSIHPYSDIISKIMRYTFKVATGKQMSDEYNHGLETLANNKLYELSSILKG